MFLTSLIVKIVLWGAGGTLALLGMKKSKDLVGGLFKKDPQVKIVQEMDETHAVATQESAASTDKEADDALDSAARSDHS